MKAIQDVTIKTTPSGALQISSPQDMRPLTSREISAIRERRSDISNQLTSSMERREELTDALKGAPPGATPGILAQIQVLDDRIVKIEQDMEASGQMLRTGLTNSSTMLVAPRQSNFNNMSEEAQVAVGLGFSFFVLLPLAIVFVRRMWVRGHRGVAPAVGAEQDSRMERLEQAVDAIAIEIERVGESQRYQTKVLAEANLMPAMGSSARAAEPLRMK